MKGLAAMAGMAQRHGIPSAGARRVRDLGPTIDRLANANPPCTDVILYVAAPGWAPPNTDIPNVAKSDQARVVIKAPAGGGQPAVEENLDHADVKKLIQDRPKLSFKFVIEACFSGRWTTLMAEPNLRITLTSSRSNELTFLAITRAERGRQVAGHIEWKGGTVGSPDEEGDPPPFTRSVVEAIDNFAGNPANANAEAGQALSDAGKNRKDRARDLGWQHGRTDDRTGERPHASPGLSVSVNGSYRHIGPGNSQTCWSIRVARGPAQVSITVTGPNG